jgi:hypothetical protein
MGMTTVQIILGSSLLVGIAASKLAEREYQRAAHGATALGAGLMSLGLAWGGMPFILDDKVNPLFAAFLFIITMLGILLFAASAVINGYKAVTGKDKLWGI